MDFSTTVSARALKGAAFSSLIGLLHQSAFEVSSYSQRETNCDRASRNALWTAFISALMLAKGKLAIVFLSCEKARLPLWAANAIR